MTAQSWRLYNAIPETSHFQRLKRLARYYSASSATSTLFTGYNRHVIPIEGSTKLIKPVTAEAYGVSVMLILHTCISDYLKC